MTLSYKRLIAASSNAPTDVIKCVVERFLHVPASLDINYFAEHLCAKDLHKHNSPYTVTVYKTELVDITVK